MLVNNWLVSFDIDWLDFYFVRKWDAGITMDYDTPSNITLGSGGKNDDLKPEKIRLIIQ